MRAFQTSSVENILSMYSAVANITLGYATTELVLRFSLKILVFPHFYNNDLVNSIKDTSLSRQDCTEQPITTQRTIVRHC